MNRALFIPSISLALTLALTACKPRLCDKCQKRQATVFLTQIQDGKITKRNLCEECAKEISQPENAQN